MKPARIVMLGFALSSGALAYVLANQSEPVAREAQPVRPDVEDVLVAGADWPVSRVLAEGDLVWKPWPSQSIQPGMIRRQAGGDPVGELRGSFVRQPVSAGEPVRREKLLRTARSSGYVAATLTPGMRAIAIPIDAQGLATAGGFIVPNDRVDVLSAVRGENADGQSARTLLANVRVLAIGQNLAERVGERVLTGATATLEVTPEQSESLALAQRTAILTLALRAGADSSPDARSAASDSIVSVIRYGAQGTR